MFADISRAITHMRLKKSAENQYGLTLSHRLAIELLKREYGEDLDRVRDGEMARQLSPHISIRRKKVLRAARNHELKTRNEHRSDKVIYMGCAGWRAENYLDVVPEVVQENGWIDVAQTASPLEVVIQAQQADTDSQSFAANQ